MVRGCVDLFTFVSEMTRRVLTYESDDRPEKKQLPGYGGLSVAGGARRESPIGDDDNEEVRQRAVAGKIPDCRFLTSFRDTSS